MGSSKKYKGKQCVYCRVNTSETADHVFPRQLFQEEQRNLLPKVPSCFQCNAEKSVLEHYLLSVLPFGATHSNAHKALSEDVTKRLSKNRKLHTKIKKGFGYKYFPKSDTELEKRLTIDLEPEKLHEFIGYVGRGLMWHHWSKTLPLEAAFKVFTPSPTGLEFVNRLFYMPTRYKVSHVLGGDTVRYKGMMSEVDDGVSAWAIQLLGGMTVAEGKGGHVFTNSFVAMISGPEESLSNLRFERKT